MIPSPWEFALLALAAYRLTRLGGWDDFPPIAAVREWVLGEEWVPTDDTFIRDFATAARPPELPGKTPESTVELVRPTYRRPLLAHLLHCPWCLGWWVCLAVWLAWLACPTWTLVLATPWAASSVVGLLAKNLDP